MTNKQDSLRKQSTSEEINPLRAALQTIHQVASAGCPVGEDGEETLEKISEVCFDALNARDSGWVPIRSEDDLPQEDGEYLVTHKDGSVGGLYFHSNDPDEPDKRVWNAGGDGWPSDIQGIIAWRPLPLPYGDTGEK